MFRYGLLPNARLSHSRRSECQLDVRMEHRAGAPESKGNGRVSHRGIGQVKKFIVPANDFVVKREEIGSGSKVPGIAILPVQRRSSEIYLESFGHHHRRRLYLKSVGEDHGKPRGARALDVVEPPQKVFAIQRVTVIFE